MSVSGGMKEQDLMCIKLHGVNKIGLKKIIDFIYTAKLSLNMDNLQDTLEAASFLQILPVLDFCKVFLISGVRLFVFHLKYLRPWYVVFFFPSVMTLTYIIIKVMSKTCHSQRENVLYSFLEKLGFFLSITYSMSLIQLADHLSLNFILIQMFYHVDILPLRV